MTNTITLLALLLGLLMTLLGGTRGLKSFITLGINLMTFLLMVLLIAWRFNPVTVTLLGALIISAVTLFFINGVNQKTLAALLSVLIVVSLTFVITAPAGIAAKIHGFTWEQMELASTFSQHMPLDFGTIVMCELLIGLLGAVIDVAISIASPLNELKAANPHLSRQALFHSGLSIGKDIMGTMTNTLLFAYIGGFTALVIWFYDLHYSLGEILNAKIFAAEVFQIFVGGLGIVLVIPVSAFISAQLLSRGTPPKHS